MLSVCRCTPPPPNYTITIMIATILISTYRVAFATYLLSIACFVLNIQWGAIYMLITGLQLHCRFVLWNTMIYGYQLPEWFSYSLTAKILWCSKFAITCRFASASVLPHIWSDHHQWSTTDNPLFWRYTKPSVQLGILVGLVHRVLVNRGSIDDNFYWLEVAMENSRILPSQ